MQELGESQQNVSFGTRTVSQIEPLLDQSWFVHWLVEVIPCKLPCFDWLRCVEERVVLGDHWWGGETCMFLQLLSHTSLSKGATWRLNFKNAAWITQSFVDVLLDVFEIWENFRISSLLLEERWLTFSQRWSLVPDWKINSLSLDFPRGPQWRMDISSQCPW